ncbi:MAG TPA: hypothetical protein VHQ97_07630 [Solirubrobacterales bacterium]|jgi:hypothetical protein|nr:hypothetical protein [Solirubrobacterales bacterium]
MGKHLKLRRPSHATVVAYLALLIALGGGAYAADQLSKNSVGNRQLKRNSVTSLKVKDGSLRPEDFAQRALQGAEGPQGPPGIPGTSRGFQAFGSVNYDKFSSSPFGSTVVSLGVPPGAYFATASVGAETVNAITSTVICRLINEGGAGVRSATMRAQPVREDSTADNFTLTALFQVTSGQRLDLECYKDNAASGARVSANIVAVQISDVTGSTD